jgi:thioesterase domain-containing protein
MLRNLSTLPTRRSAAASSFLRRLLDSDDDQREQLVAQAVHAEITAIVGRTSTEEMDHGKSFLELGLDSLASVELRNRLQAITGLQLATNIAFTRPTPLALTGYLVSLFAEERERRGQPSSTSVSQCESDSAPARQAVGTLCQLLREAHRDGKASEFMSVITDASKFRATFKSPPVVNTSAPVIRLAEGSAGPKIVCFPSIVGATGPYQYAKCATIFRGVRDVFVLPLPGYTGDELLPSNISVAVATQAQLARQVASGEPIVLLGHSTGGSFAHAVASHLQNTGQPPAGLFMIDTYSVRGMALANVQSVMTAMLTEGEDRPALTDVSLTAMAAYSSMLTEWVPEQLACPVVLLRATMPMPGVDPTSDWQASSPFPHTTIDISGDHLSMMEEYAQDTAREIEQWLSNALYQEQKNAQDAGEVPKNSLKC